MSKTKVTDRPVSGWQDAIYRRINRVRGAMFPARPSPRMGMGAIPYDRGTTFRVWAPHAKTVAVTGTFNNWSHCRTPLASEGNGYWSADVPNARPGHEYKLVIRTNRQTLVRTDPYARAIGNHSNGVIVEGLGDGQEEFYRPHKPEWVIYELHVGTFGANEGKVPATFDGVIEKLPYLRDLGINAIELMPVATFPGDISWGYNPSHPFAVSPAYGGREGLARLVRAAHEHGIAVLVDVVYNHFGPQDLSLWQFDGWHENGNGGIYFYNDWRAETPWGHTRPDYGRPEVRQYIRDNALMWLEEFGADGLRWDATAHIRNAHGHDGDPGSDIPEGWALMQWVNNELNARFPGRIGIAEDLQNNAWITTDTGAGGAGFDAQWDANFVHPIRAAIIGMDDNARDIAAVAQAITFRYGEDPFNRVIYTESHDEVANGKARVPEEIAQGDADSPFARVRSALGAALVFTAPGLPMIFQGQEFLEDGWFDDHQPLDWSKAESNQGNVLLYRDLIHLRRNLHQTSGGLCGPHVNMTLVNNEDKVIAFHRWAQGGAGDDVMVIANFANRLHESYRIGVPHDGRWSVRFRSGNQAYQLYGQDSLPDELNQAIMTQTEMETAAEEVDGLPQHISLALAPYEVVILSQ